MTNYVDLAGDTLEGKFSTAASTNLTTYLTAVWIDGEMITRGTDRWNQVMNNCTLTISNGLQPSSLFADRLDVSTWIEPLDGEQCSEFAMPPYKDLQKMRRLYQVFIIDLRTDEIDEFQCIATSDRSAELKAIAAQGIIDEVDNYQIVVRALTNVAERIEAEDE